MTRVFDLSTGRYGDLFSLEPRKAVIAAHAQSLRDYNTWDYEKKYGGLVFENEQTVRCGNFTAKKATVLLP